MGTILEQILEQKKQEVDHLRKRKNFIPESQYKRHSFMKKLQTTDELSIIAEFKRASPSKGTINNAVNPAVQASTYEKFGASAISVLTDQTFFKGSFSDLKAVREAVELPLLCKDFIIDPLQIKQAASYGADLILLIVAALDEMRLHELYQYAKGMGLEILVEIHNQKELEKAIKIGAELIGINNRDLKTFQVSLDVTEKLAAEVKNSGAFLISESGIHHQEDVKRVRNAGANGILVGEAFMKSSDINQTFVDFRLPINEGAQR
ncbi:indole-3-glycerol phosphate synthase TrpC [Neobacillus sp.]|uniref:indole-3-glycerol phosphate synthase TrpC n=1 Tax=Neobacillus sp. TaxID=2675273 RepID=UPI0028A2A1CA|nr:indole-3-glycerol phosphate synthase TrpC [Neobacillus sp.]